MNPSQIDDEEITCELWQSRLSTCFILSDKDISNINRSELLEPFYLMLSHHHYFPSIIDTIFRYYLPYYSNVQNHRFIPFQNLVQSLLTVPCYN